MFTEDNLGGTEKSKAQELWLPAQKQDLERKTEAKEGPLPVSGKIY